MLGAVLATRMSEVWLRRIFLASVLVLAAKTIVLDVAWR
jgi:uncharacterized membrane protein YfcA